MWQRQVKATQNCQAKADFTRPSHQFGIPGWILKTRQNRKLISIQSLLTEGASLFVIHRLHRPLVFLHSHLHHVCLMASICTSCLALVTLPLFFTISDHLRSFCFKASSTASCLSCHVFHACFFSTSLLRCVFQKRLTLCAPAYFTHLSTAQNPSRILWAESECLVCRTSGVQSLFPATNNHDIIFIYIYYISNVYTYMYMKYNEAT